jgi:hypothetical protein
MESTTEISGKEGESVADSTDDVASPRLSAIVLAETMSLLDEQDPTVEQALLDTTTNDAATAPKPKTTAKPATSIKPKNTYGGTTGEAVSVERKEQLLLEARVNRLQWIHQVPLPYRKQESPDDPWVQEKGLATFLKTCHAAALMPSTLKVLSYLYGMQDQRTTPEEVANRIETLVSTVHLRYQSWHLWN